MVGEAPPPPPRLAAICFFGTGATGSFRYCDFGQPAVGAAPPACAFMPELPFFRHAKRLFAQEWFTSALIYPTGYLRNVASVSYRRDQCHIPVGVYEGGISGSRG